MSDQTLRDGAQIRITGGRPTAEEVAAIVAALDAARTEGTARTGRRPAWLRAARREAVQGGLVASPAHLGATRP